MLYHGTDEKNASPLWGLRLMVRTALTLAGAGDGSRELILRLTPTRWIPSTDRNCSRAVAALAGRVESWRHHEAQRSIDLG